MNIDFDEDDNPVMFTDDEGKSYPVFQNAKGIWCFKDPKTGYVFKLNLRMRK